jgi:hypothetical protein
MHVKRCTNNSQHHSICVFHFLIVKHHWKGIVNSWFQIRGQYLFLFDYLIDPAVRYHKKSSLCDLYEGWRISYWLDYWLIRHITGQVGYWRKDKRRLMFSQWFPLFSWPIVEMYMWKKYMIESIELYLITDVSFKINKQYSSFLHINTTF